MRPRGPSFETRHFVLRGALDRLGEPLAELGPVFDEIYEYVSARTGLSVDRRIDVMLSPPEAANSVGGCPQRGMATPRYAATENLAAFGAIDDITILAAPDLPRVQLLGVLAHELGHVLMFEWLRDDFGASSTAIGEGFATWAAGRYMTDWYGIESLQAGVAELVRTGRYTPIAEQPGPYYTVPPDPDAAAPGEAVCLARRDRLYTEWGGFVGYLAEQGGTDVLLDLLRSAPGPDPFASVWGALDYSGIYGRELEALEADWLESL